MKRIRFWEKDFYGESVYHIASFNAIKNNLSPERRTRRSAAQLAIIIQYLKDLPPEKKE